MYHWIAVAMLVMFAIPAATQITYTRSFAKKLQRASLEYYEPVEQWLHVTPMTSDAFMQYDLVLQNDRNDYEIRYRIRRLNHRWRQIPQQVEIGRLVASISSNIDSREIRMEFPDTVYLRNIFNADEGLFAHFTPKPGFSEKPFGTLISIYAENKAVVDIVLLYQDETYRPIPQDNLTAGQMADQLLYGNLRFKKTPDSEQ